MIQSECQEAPKPILTKLKGRVKKSRTSMRMLYRTSPATEDGERHEAMKEPLERPEHLPPSLSTQLDHTYYQTLQDQHEHLIQHHRVIMEHHQTVQALFQKVQDAQQRRQDQQPALQTYHQAL